MAARGIGGRVAAVVIALAAQPLGALAQDAGAEPAAKERQTLVPSWAEPDYVEFYGSVAFEGIGFPDDARFEGQDNAQAIGSVAIEPSLLMEWSNGAVAATVTPFLRLDGVDDRRSHWDLRVAKIDVRDGDWEATFGVDFVFWGRTEAIRLVDVINTVDGVEGVDEEVKLGQPMVRITRLTEIGAFSGYYMPYFRERTFRGEQGRLRAGVPVNDNDARFGTDGGEWTPSFAVSWEHFVGDFDIRAHGFQGVSRDPAFEVFQVDGFGAPTALRPVYDDIAQIGLDGQYTSGPALWKLETLYRTGQRDRSFDKTDYWAAAGGVEYTFFGVFESDADLGLIAEAAYDAREGDALTPFNRDVVVGARLALNDTQDTAFLVTSARDVVSGSTSLRLEVERRVFESWRLELEAQAFVETDPDDVEADLQDDSFFRATMSYFW